jgi:hypothetical protein
MWDSVHPSMQDLETQVSHDTWIMEILTYFKHDILPDNDASTI